VKGRERESPERTSCCSDVHSGVTGKQAPQQPELVGLGSGITAWDFKPQHKVMDRVGEQRLDDVQTLRAAAVTGAHGHNELRNRETPPGGGATESPVCDQLRDLGALQLQAP